jgi:hypothetical protein
MRILREWIQRLQGTLLPGRRDADLEHEIRSHMEMAAQDARRRGLDPGEASRAAREAPRKPWTRSGISEAFRGWTTWRAT